MKAIDTLSCKKKIEPGKIIIEDKNIFVGTNDGAIGLEELQLEGKSTMNSKNFINGYLGQLKSLKFVNPIYPYLVQ